MVRLPRPTLAVLSLALGAHTALAAPQSLRLADVGEVRISIAPTSNPSIFTGALEGEPESTVIYIEHEGITLAEVRSPRLGVFTSQPSPTLDALSRVDHDHHAHDITCGCEMQHDLEAPDTPKTPAAPAYAAANPIASRGVIRGAGALCDDPSVIDVLVYYTDDARLAAGGVPQIEAQILLGIGNINTALTNSGVAMSVNLLGPLELNYDETGSAFTDIERIRDVNDGVADAIHATRDELRGDVVMLVTNTSAPCGVAGFGMFAGPTPAPENAFSIVNRNCIGGGTLTFAHELGHNFGVFHDWPNDQKAYGATLYAKGYTAPDDSFNTLMAVAAGPPRQLLFSSPDIMFMGQPAGRAYDPMLDPYTDRPADSVRALNETLHLVADYRTHDQDGDGVCDADEITAGTAADINGNTIPDAAEFDCDRDGVPDAWQIAQNASLDLDGDGVLDACEPSRLYVDATATGANTGLSWSDAHTDLHSALTIANLGESDVNEIWVAAGTYYAAPTDARGVSFDMPSGVSLRGGFAGGETDAGQADPVANPTILSGDGAQDDGPGFANRADNAFNIMRGGDDDFGPSIIDGFTFSGGNSDLPFPTGYINYYQGGAMTVFRADVTFTRCTFTDNQATNGGALSLSNFSTTFLTDCDFIGNRALGESGGAVYTQNNPATDFPTFERCRFIANTAPSSSGAVSNIAGTPTFINCLFVGNSSGSRAGAMGNTGAVNTPAIITNCTFIANNAGSGGAGSAIENFRSAPTITNSIFWNNGSGGGTNNNISLIGTESIDTEVANCLIEGWTPGDIGDNIATGDPRFASPPSDGGDGYGDDPSTMGVNESANDDYGDLSLTAGSAAIDAGDNSRLPMSVLTDFAGEARYVDDPTTTDTGVGAAPIVDIGAFEAPADDVPCTGDYTGDNLVNFEDINEVLEAWGDLYDFNDLNAVLDNWAESCN